MACTRRRDSHTPRRRRPRRRFWMHRTPLGIPPSPMWGGPPSWDWWWGRSSRYSFPKQSTRRATARPSLAPIPPGCTGDCSARACTRRPLRLGRPFPRPHRQCQGSHQTKEGSRPCPTGCRSGTSLGRRWALWSGWLWAKAFQCTIRVSSSPDTPIRNQDCAFCRIPYRGEACTGTPPRSTRRWNSHHTSRFHRSLPGIPHSPISRSSRRAWAQLCQYSFQESSTPYPIPAPCPARIPPGHNEVKRLHPCTRTLGPAMRPSPQPCTRSEARKLEDSPPAPTGRTRVTMWGGRSATTRGSRWDSLSHHTFPDESTRRPSEGWRQARIRPDHRVGRVAKACTRTHSRHSQSPVLQCRWYRSHTPPDILPSPRPLLWERRSGRSSPCSFPRRSTPCPIPVPSRARIPPDCTVPALHRNRTPCRPSPRPRRSRTSSPACRRTLVGIPPSPTPRAWGKQSAKTWGPVWAKRTPRKNRTIPIVSRPVDRSEFQARIPVGDSTDCRERPRIRRRNECRPPL
mmetsp:Transcript_25337/g.60901  ORF Transcript_25337/g.60901 Transcript_25337/m.60901 type:complete len:514 (-) Transcript_25337:274-1815(-)